MESLESLATAIISTNLTTRENRRVAIILATGLFELILAIERNRVERIPLNEYDTIKCSSDTLDKAICLLCSVYKTNKA